LSILLFAFLGINYGDFTPGGQAMLAVMTILVVVACLLAIFLMSAIIAGLCRAGKAARTDPARADSADRIGPDWSFLFKPPIIAAWVAAAVWIGVILGNWLNK
jgi:hypothetical protein